jgi:membrane protease YdiL (CAAX protease family)
MRPYLDKQSVALLAFFPSVALGLLNALWSEPLYKISPTLFWLADTTQWLLVPLLIWLLVLRSHKISFADIGFRPSTNNRNPLQSFGLGECALALFILGFAYFLADRAAHAVFWRYGGSSFGYGIAVAGLADFKYIAVMYLAVTAALVEEVVFRGLPWLYLSKGGSGTARKIVYVVFTSVIFAATHSEQGLAGVVSSFAYGVVAAMLFLRTRNLYPVVFSHFVIDVFSFWQK